MGFGIFFSRFGAILSLREYYTSLELYFPFSLRHLLWFFIHLYGVVLCILAKRMHPYPISQFNEQNLLIGFCAVLLFLSLAIYQKLDSRTVSNKSTHKLKIVLTETHRQSGKKT